MQYQIWYMKPAHFREGIMGYDWCLHSGNLPNVRELEKTHVYVKTIEVPTLVDAFMYMQASCWMFDVPTNEANDVIRKLGLQHTSMCVGDLAIASNGVVAVCDNVGWKELGVYVATAKAG